MLRLACTLSAQAAWRRGHATPRATCRLAALQLRACTTVVQDVASARRVCEQMQALPDAADRFFACDTEVVDIDVKRHSPVGHGRVICASIFCGPDVDFGSGSRVWIDNHGEAEVGHSGRARACTCSAADWDVRCVVRGMHRGC